jgi:hypothetical protein
MTSGFHYIIITFFRNVTSRILVDKYQTLQNSFQEDSDHKTTVTEIEETEKYLRLLHNGKKLLTLFVLCRSLYCLCVYVY